MRNKATRPKGAASGVFPKRLPAGQGFNLWVMTSPSVVSGFRGVFVSEFATRCCKGYGAGEAFKEALLVASRFCHESPAKAVDQVMGLQGGNYSTFAVILGKQRPAEVRWPSNTPWPECV